MNNKKLPRKTTSAIFLAIVLVAGTITLLFSSSMTNAQAQPYSGYNSYGPEYLDSNNYNSYESDYGMENKYGKPYGNDNNYYESQYQSYKSDYKPQYPSYDKDNYKSQKDSSNVNVKKIKCNNINININNGQDGNGNTTSGNETNNGFKKFNKDGFAFVYINNNNNVVVGVDEDENGVTPPELLTCEECFSANNTLQAVIEDFLIDQIQNFTVGVDSEILLIPGDVDTIEQLCSLLEGHTDVLLDSAISLIVEQQTGSFTAFAAEINALVEYLLEAGVMVEATV